MTWNNGNKTTVPIQKIELVARLFQFEYQSTAIGAQQLVQITIKKRDRSRISPFEQSSSSADAIMQADSTISNKIVSRLFPLQTQRYIKVASHIHNKLLKTFVAEFDQQVITDDHENEDPSYGSNIRSSSNVNDLDHNKPSIDGTKAYKPSYMNDTKCFKLC